MDDVSKGRPEEQISTESAEALGRFVVAWGSVEHEIEAIITGIFIMVPVFRSIVTAGITLDPKISMIVNGLAVGGNALLKEEELTDFYEILNKLRKLINEYRNTIYHSIVMPTESGKTMWAAKFTGGKKPRLKKIPITVDYINKATSEIASCRDNLREMARKVRQAYAQSEDVFVRRASTEKLQKELRHREMKHMTAEEWENLIQKSKAK